MARLARRTAWGCDFLRPFRADWRHAKVVRVGDQILPATEYQRPSRTLADAIHRAHINHMISAGIAGDHLALEPCAAITQQRQPVDAKVMVDAGEFVR